MSRWLILLVVLCSAISAGARTRTFILSDRAADGQMCYADTLYGDTPDTMLIAIPDNMELERFWPYMFLDSIDATLTNVTDSVNVSYIPYPGKVVTFSLYDNDTNKVASTVSIKLDTLASGSKPVNIPWRCAAGDSSAIWLDWVPKGFYWSYVRVANSATEYDEFRPPSSNYWAFIFNWDASATSKRAKLYFVLHYKIKQR